MGGMRALAELDVNWGGCVRDSFDLATVVPWGKAKQRKVADRSRKLLTQTIETEIIPRLVVAHTSLQAAKQAETGNIRPTAEDVMQFVDVLITDDVTVASSYVEQMCLKGATLETIFLDLFTPAARILGALWEKDICDFTDVTIALSRLQQLLRELSDAFEIEEVHTEIGGKALLVAAPGDQHTFGAFILQEFFRRAGWEVAGGALASNDELYGLAENKPYDLIGLSFSNEVPVDIIASVIRTVRDVAQSPRLHVMVGGRFFLEHPDYVPLVGADATAKDGRRAVQRVSSLLGTTALR